ncbi:MAG: hypothetical protein KatS3mg109_2160 [Pirellulaceae bacterium]|nr:MAG: hypothetical protein KatS3mg105_5269 [Gemmatales bacterium]GIW90328.1 MAG: hypothetical protein KatS3mg109_0760 [Pirellulaceae bacterium]GIW91728.1 MAG: hypothetical protein KatS3mg109_2160 [Pirellulaceae bacterium]
MLSVVFYTPTGTATAILEAGKLCITKRYGGSRVVSVVEGSFTGELFDLISASRAVEFKSNQSELCWLALWDGNRWALYNGGEHKGHRCSLELVHSVLDFLDC